MVFNAYCVVFGLLAWDCRCYHVGSIYFLKYHTYMVEIFMIFLRCSWGLLRFYVSYLQSTLSYTLMLNREVLQKYIVSFLYYSDSNSASCWRGEASAVVDVMIYTWHLEFLCYKPQWFVNVRDSKTHSYIRIECECCVYAAPERYWYRQRFHACTLSISLINHHAIYYLLVKSSQNSLWMVWKWS